jgi:2-dehydropantoate 2-reductase
MRILVYGAGAVGGFFGGLLAHAGKDVHFVARGAQLEALRTSGLTIDSRIRGTIVLPSVSTSDSAASAGISDLILVCVKTQQLAGILDDLASAVGEQTVIVPLQNGVEADDRLAARFPHATVLPAVVYVGATLDTPGVVTHVASGTIGIGPRRERDSAVLAPICDVLASTGQPVHISKNIQRERWHKLMWNTAFNSVSAITGRVPAALIAQPETRALVIAIMNEVLSVGRACGVDLRPGDIDAHIAWTESAAGLRTSTMVDRERGRAMESDGLVGVIVRKGREAGVPTPCSDVVYALLNAIDVGSAGSQGARGSVGGVQ